MNEKRHKDIFETAEESLQSRCVCIHENTWHLNITFLRAKNCPRYQHTYN